MLLLRDIFQVNKAKEAVLKSDKMDLNTALVRDKKETLP